MHLSTSLIAYPEGEEQEIDRLLPFGALVGLNGVILEPPLPTHKMIAYRVEKIRRMEERGETTVIHYLELVPADELLEFTRGR